MLIVLIAIVIFVISVSAIVLLRMRIIDAEERDEQKYYEEKTRWKR